MFLFKKDVEAVKKRWEASHEKKEIEIVHAKYDAHSEDHVIGGGQTLFVAKPDRELKSYPVVFDIHGGSFCRGSKEVNRPFCLYLASLGYAVVGMDFPLAYQTDYLGELKGIVNAIQWGVDHCKEQAFDLNNAFLMGNSSGGQQALAILALSQSKGFQKTVGIPFPELKFKAAVLNHPVCYFNDLKGSDGEEKKEIEVLKKVLFDNGVTRKLFKTPEAFSQAIGNAYPPLRVISSQGDVRYLNQAVMLVNFLNNVNADLESDISPNGELGHNYNIVDPDSLAGAMANNAIDVFFKAHMTKR